MEFPPTKRRTVPVHALAMILAVTAQSAGSQIDATWLGGSGDWTNPPLWDVEVFPNNTMSDTYRVFIDGGLMSLSDVSLNAAVTIDALTVDTDDTLRLIDGGALTLDASVTPATVSGGGAIALEASAGQTAIVAGGGDVTLSGGGTLTLTNNLGNIITGSGATPRLVNEDWQISGAGQVGANMLALINRGAISATYSNSLTIDPNATGAINRGTLSAATGGHLVLTGGTFANSESSVNGTILADGGRVDIISATVNGGIAQVSNNGELLLRSATLSGTAVVNSAGGTIRLPNHSQLHTTTLSGSLNNPSGASVLVGSRGTLGLSGPGPFDNNGEIILESNAPVASMTLGPGLVTVNGTGKILMNPSANNSVMIIGNPWTNNGNSIEGAGSIDGVTNLGTITGNRTSPLHISSTKNAGLIHAVDGGTIESGLIPLANTVGAVEGTIRADGDGTVILNDVNGGLIGAQPGGILILKGNVNGAQVRAHSGGKIQGGIGASQFSWLTGGGSNVTIDDGGMVIMDNDTWRMSTPATYVNNGTIKLGGSEGPGTIDLRGHVVISGTGEIDMSGNTSNLIRNDFPLTSLVIDQTVHGTGFIGSMFNGTPITNNGSIIADEATPLTIRINPNAPVGGPLTNAGKLIASGSGGLVLFGSFVNSTGEIIVNPESSMSMQSTIHLIDGSMTVNGPVVNPSGIGFMLSVEGGVLNGNSFVNALVTSSGGIVSPGTLTGTLSLLQSYTQTLSGTLHIEIGGLTAGTEYDRLAVSGTANLGGTLSIELVNDFPGSIGDSFTIMTFAAKTGDFDAIDAPCLPGGVRIAVTVGPTDVVAEIVAPLASDINCDCASTLDDADALALALIDPDAFVKLYDPCDISTADVNNDMSIDGLDIQAFLDAFLP